MKWTKMICLACGLSFTAPALTYAAPPTPHERYEKDLHKDMKKAHKDAKKDKRKDKKDDRREVKHAPRTHYVTPTPAHAHVPVAKPGVTHYVTNVRPVAPPPVVHRPVVPPPPNKLHRPAHPEVVVIEKTVVHEVHPTRQASMRRAEFDDFMRSIRRAAFSRDRVHLVEIAARNNTFSSDQVYDILREISFSDDQEHVACLLYERTVDPRNWHKIYDAITFSSTREAIERCTR